MTNQKSVSNGDYTFTARSDGKYTYCFGNEHWGANSKEVHFNVHGIVYVNEADVPSDPLEKEGKPKKFNRTLSYHYATFKSPFTDLLFFSPVS